MAALPREVEQKIRKYLDALRENNINIQRAVVFGSFARGTYDEWSDIDIAIVSDIFIGDRIADKSKVRRITLQIGSDIELAPFAPADFNEDNPFVKEILLTGIEIK